MEIKELVEMVMSNLTEEEMVDEEEIEEGLGGCGIGCGGTNTQW